MLSGLTSRLVFIIALSLVACFGSGCTYMLWDSANKPLQYQDMPGTTPLTTLPGGRALVVQYEFSGEQSIVLVPLNADGSAQPPFDFPPDKIEILNLTFKIPEEQRAAIFASAAVHAATAPSSITEIIPDSECCRGYTQANHEFDRKSDGLVAITYGVDDRGRIIAIRSKTDSPNLPDGGHVRALHAALVPAERPRSQATRDHDRTVAIFLTPFAVVADCAFYVTVCAIGIAIAPVMIPLTILAGGMH